MSKLLEVSTLRKAFNKKVILDTLSFSLAQGEVVALLGRSGCGKSTLIKILVGYYQADAGSIHFEGKQASDSPLNMRQYVGYTTQDNSFYEKLTLEENMKYYAQLYHVPSKEAAKRSQELLQAVGLWDHHKTLAGNLSGGMKRRLDFAISLIHKPRLVILDEPTTGLDPFLIEAFWEIVTSLAHKEKLGILVSSHHLAEVQKYCTRLIVLKQGKISKEATVNKSTNVDELFRKYS